MDFESLPLNSYVGPVSQMIQYVYGALTCSVSKWLLFRDDAYYKVKDQFFNNKFFVFDIQRANKNLFAQAKQINYSRQQVSDFVNQTLAQVDKLKTNLLNFNGSVTIIDTLVKSSLDDLTRNAYSKSMDSLKNNIQAAKSCVPDIMNAMQKMLTTFTSSLTDCIAQTINLNTFDTSVSSAQAMVTTLFKDLNACVANLTKSSSSAYKLRAQLCAQRVRKIQLCLVQAIQKIFFYL